MESNPISGKNDSKKIDETPGDLLPIGTVDEIIEAAPGDIVTEVINIPEWNCAVELQSFTAAESASIRSIGIGFKGDNTEVAWAEMEKQQFLLGVKRPDFTPTKVAELHMISGRGFARVISWLDEKSNLDKEALKSARDEFLGQNKSEEV